MDKKIRLSVVIPAYNEASSIRQVIRELVIYLSKLSLDKYEVVIIDDGSMDNTKEVLEYFTENNKNIRIVTHKFRRGVGGAIKTAFRSGKYEWILLFPGDGQANPRDIARFISAIQNGDIVVGYREKRVDPRYRYFTSDLWRWLISYLFRVRFKDINWVKLVKKEVIDNIPMMSKSAFIDAEILLRAAKMGYKIIEIPSEHRKRISGKTKCFAFFIVMDAVEDIIRLRKTMKKFYGLK